MDSGQQISDEAGQNLFSDVLTLYVEPEIARRHETGTASIPFDLSAAQVLLFADGRLPELRLNSEVRAHAQMWVTPQTDKVAGSPIFESEVSGVESLTLRETEDPNCGHITIVRVGGRYSIFFDFIYNKGHARELLQMASQFLRTAGYAAQHKMWAAFIDNLYSAMELAVKGLLWTSPFGFEFKSNTTHKTIRRTFQSFASLGNVPTEHVSTFEHLYAARPRVRYGKANIPEDWENAAAWLGHVNEIIQRGDATISRPSFGAPPGSI